ncbi:hypothetical protein BDA99DRAFT_540065 [Phascolomyces articulosus]|uniref:PB1 domain-containing protein n=1 Tax=Phascolomyces articulosus TaxID=60185 RepID=A0AAD5JUJ9_9FUNG|nr:hypothetical protein BDA99DRAFT_540065 [Phascolomyces articulosus]
MAHARVDDVDIKTIHCGTGIFDQSLCYNQDDDNEKQMLKIEEKYKIPPEAFTISYQDHEGERFSLETDDDLTCAFNRREKPVRQHGSTSSDVHHRSVYFLRVFVEPHILPGVKQQHQLDLNVSNNVTVATRTSNEKLQHPPSSYIQGTTQHDQLLNMYINSMAMQDNNVKKTDDVAGG